MIIMEIYEPITATNFSFLRGASHPHEIVTQAKMLGLKGVGIADKNTLSGVVRAHVKAKELGIKILIGARLVDKEQHETIIYPKNRQSYAALSKIISDGNRRTKKGECDLEKSDIIEAMNDASIIFMPDRKFTKKWQNETIKRVAKAPINASLYIALKRRYEADDFELNCKITQFAERNNIKIIATSDALMHSSSRRSLCDILTCIREKTSLDNAGYLTLRNAEQHLKSPHEILRIFFGFEDAINAQSILFSETNFSLDELKYEYPDIDLFKENNGKKDIDILRHFTEIGANKRYPKGIPDKVRKALDYEYQLVDEMDYSKYFLTVFDMVNFARSVGILCQGRGSAANSSICFCLGITSVDPTKVDLLFDRFISKERNEPPDIDVDFENIRREEVIQYIYNKYGREHAGIAGVVVTYRARSALREVAKALSLSNDIINALTKAASSWGSTINSEIIARMSGLDLNAPRIKETIELAQILLGFPRHLSQHVGGFVITKSRLDEVVPLSNAAMPDRTFVEWDKDDLDALGILKIDVLALGMLTCVSKSFEILKDKYSIEHDMSTIPQSDLATYDMICRADTIGVFQIESRAQMSMLPRLRPREFYDLVIETAIVRPGPIQGNMVHPFLLRRQGKEKVTYPSTELMEVLHKTLGVPLFQEQAMKIAIVAAGFTPSEADKLRRAMATFRRTGIIHELKERFLDGMIKNGYSEEFSHNCFSQIEGFGEYGFPESHAASFALIIYVSAWLKCHYPDVFLTAILNSQPMGFYSPSQLIDDAKKHGVTVLPIDINYSDWDNKLEMNNQKYAVRLGIRQIVGFHEYDAFKIIAAREAKNFDSIEDLKKRAKLNARSMELLANADSFSSVKTKRRDALWISKGLKEGELPLFNSVSEYGFEEIANLPEMQFCEEVKHDYINTHLSLKGHPVQFFRNELTKKGIFSTKDIPNISNNNFISISGLVLLRQRPGTANGVMFMTIEDEFGTANIIFWTDVLNKYRKDAILSKFAIIHGQMQTIAPEKLPQEISINPFNSTPVTHIICRRITDITPWLSEINIKSREFH